MGTFKYMKSISFERPSLVFTAGESIKGNLIFDGAPTTSKIFDLHLILTGVVRQSNSYRPYVENKRHLSDYSYNILQTYSKCRVTKGTEDAVTIPAKTRTEVGFELDIPESLWSTFLGGLGYTVYRIIIIGRPNSAIFAKEGVLCHKEIVIIGLVNSIRDGFVDEFNETKVFTSKSGGNQTAKLSVHLDKMCATPGDMFSFRVKVENGLKLPLGAIKMVFQQNVTYDFSGMPSLFLQKDKEVNFLVQKEGPTIPPGPGRTVPWNWSFQIPHTVPSEMGAEGCPLIKVSYCILFIVAKFVNLKVTVPIHLGTPTSDESEWEELSLEYGKLLKRSLSSQSLAAWGDDKSESCWSLLELEGAGEGGSRQVT